jgi:alkylated DNA repair dioxygenase AlkB
MPDADVCIYRDFFTREESDNIFQELLDTIKWQQDTIKYYGKEVNLPRLTAWYGDSGAYYTYSNISMHPHAWTPILSHIKGRIEKVAYANFNSVLLNLYRHGKDSVSWHQDNEPELGKNPIIASVSFGAVRLFQFKHKFKKDLSRFDTELTHGSLLIMKGSTQQFWQHKIPKTRRKVGKRINLTFRMIYRADLLKYLP